MLTVSLPCQKFARPSLLYYFTKKVQGKYPDGVCSRKMIVGNSI